MKKPYQKPSLFAESFRLVEHIAGPCDNVGRASYQNASSCHYDAGDANGFLFLNNANGCAYDPADGSLSSDDIQGFEYECEYTFSTGTKLFAS